MQAMCVGASPKTQKEQGRSQGSLQKELWAWTEGGLGRKRLCSALRLSLWMVQPFGHSCPVERPVCSRSGPICLLYSVPGYISPQKT